MRLFVALNFPNAVKESITEVIRQAASNAERGRFVRSEQIHLTLEFLGEVQGSRVGLVKSAMDELECAAFSLKLTKVGRFKRRDGDIYWLGVEPSPALLALQGKLHEGLEARGFVLEKRAYKPHITLGRDVVLKTGYNIDELSRLIEGTETHITRVDLMKSEFVPGGVKYSVLYSRPLREDEIRK